CSGRMAFALLRWNLLLMLSVSQPSALAFQVTEGSSVVLSCQYSVKLHGLSHVCWGRDCGTFWCNDILVQTDDHGVTSRLSDRYRLIGDILSGQMDLGIQKIQRTDSGTYCCRVDIDGLFNDKKVSYTLKVLKVETVTVWAFSAVLLLKGVCLCRVQFEDPLPSITLQVNIPVLSLSLSLLLLLVGALSLLAVKRNFSPKEPRHIIYEIRTRRPVEENIYTLE
uniref:Ig-like domain-containing protein n=1 Tax=Denticeps clupeoides TaxID=299321 RepID=A0AAY4ANV1_9TELE